MIVTTKSDYRSIRMMDRKLEFTLWQLCLAAFVLVFFITSINILIFVVYILLQDYTTEDMHHMIFTTVTNILENTKASGFPFSQPQLDYIETTKRSILQTMILLLPL